MSKLFAASLIMLLLALLAAHAPAQERARQVKPPAAGSTAVPPSGVSGNAATEVGEGDVVRVDTDLVTIPASVRDRQGRFIYDLKKEDFSIFENGSGQDIAFFEAVETPFTVILMLDTSSSTWLKHEKIKDAAIAFVNQLRADDRVMVVSFSNEVTVEAEPTSDRSALQRAIRKVGKGWNTRLYDALDWAIKGPLKQIRGRKAVVLLTDGVDSSSKRASYKTNIRDVEELDALLYPVQYDTYRDMAVMTGGMNTPLPSIISNLPPIASRLPPFPKPKGAREGYKKAGEYLRDLAEKTGGRLYPAGEGVSFLSVAFSQIVEELSHQYRLGYYPVIKRTGRERRQIRVRVSRADVAVRARDSYIYQPASASNSRSATTTQDKQPRQK